jgi:large subunit ribosomal protein L25
MANQRIELNVEARKTGKHYSRKLRRERKVPAIIYGSVENKNISLDEGAILKYHTRAYENALFNLKSADDSKLNNVVVLMKSVVVHPVTRKPEHVDLFALDLKKQVRVNVEIRFEGKPIGLADGGLLNIVNRQVEIECLPTEIPEALTIDVSHMGIGDALHVSDLKLPAGVKLMSSPTLTLAVVNVLEEETKAAAATPEAGAAAPGAAAGAAGAAAKPADAKGGAKPDAKAAEAKAPAKAPAKK